MLIDWRGLATLVLAVATTALLWAQDLSVRSYLDRTEVAVGQQFTLNVEISGAGSGSAAEPDLPDLESFAVFLGSGSSQQIQLVNGRMSSSRTLSYHFQATEAGDFEIGPVTVLAGGSNYRTDPIQIRIRQAGRPSRSSPGRANGLGDEGAVDAEDLFVRARAGKTTVFQNEAVVVTYDIYTRVDVSSYAVSRLPEMTGFWVEDYPLGQQPPTRTEVVGGRRYTVATIKQMALLPTTAGTKTIEPLILECQVRVQRRSFDLFDDFFSRDLLGRTVTRVVASNPIALDVKPLPEGGKPGDFQGAVGSFAVKTGVDRSQVNTNDAVTLKVVISGQGNLTTLIEPEVSLPAGFESYPPKVSERIQRTTQGLRGEKTFEHVIIPRLPGVRKIPVVRLAYFDPEVGAYGVSASDEITIEVAKGEDLPVSESLGFTRKELELLGQDIRYIKTEPGSFLETQGSLQSRFSYWMALLTPVFALVAALAYSRRMNRLESDVAYARSRRASREARKRLSKAGSSVGSSEAEFYAEVGKALTGFLADKLNVAEAGMITRQVEQSLLDKGVEKSTVRAYFDCLRTCDFKRFAPSSAGDAKASAFLKQAENAIAGMEKELRAKKAGRS